MLPIAASKEQNSQKDSSNCQIVLQPDKVTQVQLSICYYNIGQYVGLVHLVSDNTNEVIGKYMLQISVEEP